MSDPIILAIVLVLALTGLCVVLAGYVRAVLRRKHDSISSRFNFDAFKNREISRRGVHDKTKWD